MASGGRRLQPNSTKCARCVSPADRVPVVYLWAVGILVRISREGVLTRESASKRTQQLVLLAGSLNINEDGMQKVPQGTTRNVYILFFIYFSKTINYLNFSEI